PTATYPLSLHDALPISRVLLCSGKIAHELKAERDRRHDTRTAVVRLEQLYPVPRAAIAALLEACPAATEIVWVQEEPRNMGALEDRKSTRLNSSHVAIS